MHMRRIKPEPLPCAAPRRSQNPRCEPFLGGGNPGWAADVGRISFSGRLACKELSIAHVLASPLRGFAQELKNKTETERGCVVLDQPQQGCQKK
jgi:hypothetical protein